MVQTSSALLTADQAVNHEFINSLTSVKALSELLLDYPGLEDGDRNRFLNLILNETERLTRLMAQMQTDGAV
jgi:signal transduction histidine kinase